MYRSLSSCHQLYTSNRHKDFKINICKSNKRIILRHVLAQVHQQDEEDYITPRQAQAHQKRTRKV